MDLTDVFFLILILILIYTLYNVYFVYSIDGFKNMHYPTGQLCKAPLTTPNPEISGPAETTLETPREPYHLLGDYMRPASQEGRIANFTSESAYMSDAQRYIEKTGNYGQLTNNYKHKKPDNGSTWLHELSLSFYE